jgi:glycine/D-amino acid oxidase-like deaminating enzyme
MTATGNCDEPIRSILIVGGGTAGWLSAAYLQRALGDGVRITLVESPTIGRIGVGEATVSTLRMTMKFLGLDDEDWMPACNATYKTAIKFRQWRQPPETGDDHFYHPFFERHEDVVRPFGVPYFPERGEGVSLVHYWHKERLRGDTTPFAYAAMPGPAICDARKAPRHIGDPAYHIHAAYHLDAHLLAGFLTELCGRRGVVRIAANVAHVELGDDRHIRAVVTTDGARLEADLFLDCTGFRSLLLEGALGEPFRSEGQSLLCDRAVALYRRTDAARDGIAPYTSATAARCGWIWEIPLYHRFGTGYVYSSRFCSEADAEAELRAHLGPACDGFTANHIKMRPGRHRAQWVGNCVAVGLSGSFVEPLESTTIFLIEYTLAHLVQLFPDRRFAPARLRRFNETMDAMYEEIRDFIVLHYVLAGRNETPFWQAVHAETVIPPSLQRTLEFLDESLPITEQFTSFVFRERSYTCLLDGLDRLPRHASPLLEHLGDHLGLERLAALRERTKTLVSGLPDHHEYLTDMYRRAGRPLGAAD